MNRHRRSHTTAAYLREVVLELTGVDPRPFSITTDEAVTFDPSSRRFRVAVINERNRLEAEEITSDG